MLSKDRRLRSAEVREVIASGRSVRGGAFLSARYLSAKGGLRAAAVVPKAVAKSAPVRNRLRRAVYRALGELPRSTEGTLVFFVRKIPPPPLAPALRLEIEGILNDARSFSAQQEKNRGRN